MAASESNSESIDQNENQPTFIVRVTTEVRQIAQALLQVFDSFLVDKPNSSGIPGISTNQTLRFSVVILILKIFNGSHKKALESLSRLGKVKNHEFPSTLEDHYYRSSTRDRIGEFRQDNRPIVGAIIGTSGFLPATIPADLGFLDPTQRFGCDPLEEPSTLQAEAGPDFEVLVFLEHYFPYELAETVRNLADTPQEDCLITVQSLALFTEFRRCFCSFKIIRTALPSPNREFSRFFDAAHADLLRLAVIIQDTAIRGNPFEADFNATAQSQPSDVGTPAVANGEFVINTVTPSASPLEQSHDPEPLRITIQKHPSEHFRVIAGGGICAEKSSQKRTIIAIALLNGAGISPQEFCQLYLGQKSERAPAQMYDCLKSAGLLRYRTSKRPYRFPTVRFELEGSNEAELYAFLKQSKRE